MSSRKTNKYWEEQIEEYQITLFIQVGEWRQVFPSKVLFMYM